MEGSLIRAFQPREKTKRPSSLWLGASSLRSFDARIIARASAPFGPRSSSVLLLPAIALLAVFTAACGGEPDDRGAGGPPQGVCDLSAIAASLIGPAGSCPPKRIVVDTESKTIERYGQSDWEDDQACTQFELEGDGCSGACAPMSCSLEGELVRCDPRCSRERITCFILPESACLP